MRSLLCVVFSVVFLLPSCVTRSRLKKDVAAAKAETLEQADKECLTIQKKLSDYIFTQNEELKKRDKILKKFNQVDDRGNLYDTASPSRAAERLKKQAQSWDDPTGNEPWMK